MLELNNDDITYFIKRETEAQKIKVARCWPLPKEVAKPAELVPRTQFFHHSTQCMHMVYFGYTRIVLSHMNFAKIKRIGTQSLWLSDMIQHSEA